MRNVISALLSSAVIALAVPSLRAETNTCKPVTSLPFVISNSGIYCLTRDFSVNMPDGQAISINASHVVLDLNGHRIGNLSAGPTTQADGIYSTGHINLNIKNGTIRGFRNAISLIPGDDDSGIVIEDLRLDRNVEAGVLVLGKGAIVRNNQILETGPGRFGAIVMSGPGGHRVINNDIMTAPSGGITFTGNPDIGEDNLAVNNRISEASSGISYLFGATGKYRDNLTTSVVTPYSGGTDAGNNN
jgi:hypothetical protein